jgi:hypothetical protein
MSKTTYWFALGVSVIVVVMGTVLLALGLDRPGKAPIPALGTILSAISSLSLALVGTLTLFFWDPAQNRLSCEPMGSSSAYPGGCRMPVVRLASQTRRSQTPNHLPLVWPDKAPGELAPVVIAHHPSQETSRTPHRLPLLATRECADTVIRGFYPPAAAAPAPNAAQAGGADQVQPRGSPRGCRGWLLVTGHRRR